MAKNQTFDAKNDAVQGLLSNFKGELGYKEGKGNQTKYAKEYFPSLQNEPWCDTFVDAMFVKTFGRENAEKMLGGFSAYTPTSHNLYKQNGRWNEARSAYIPEPGDQIFFQPAGGRINHTGIVTRFDKEKRVVYTIEGNTSAKPDDREGTTVKEKSYPLDHARIRGYGTPDWSVIVSNDLSISSKGNAVDQKTTVRQWQTDLNKLGYKDLSGKELVVDGIVGKNTDYAIRAFQRDHGLEIDGVIGPKTSAALDKAIAQYQAEQEQSKEVEAQGQQQAVDPEENLGKKPAEQQESAACVCAKEEKPDAEQDKETEMHQPADDKQKAVADQHAAQQAQQQQLMQNNSGINLDVSILVQLPVALIKGLESLVSKLGELIPTININLSLYCANNCMKSGVHPGDIKEASLEQTDTGKNLICMSSADGQKLVTADIDKGMQTPVEQSIASINEQYAQQQQGAEQQQQQKAMTVS